METVIGGDALPAIALATTMTLSDNLVKALHLDGIQPNDYRPAYGGESVGLDLYNAGRAIEIPPLSALQNKGGNIIADKRLTADRRQKVFIPTGLRIACPRYHAAILKERGSITKTPLMLRAGVIDPGYTGEIFVNLVNCDSKPYTIQAFQKLPVQIVVTPVLTDYIAVPAEEYKKLTDGSLRAEGRVGSTD